MSRIKKIGKKLIYLVGSITTIVFIGAVLFFFYIKVINPETADISYNDGPHIFYLNDSTIKTVVIKENQDNSITVHENVVSLSDSAARKSIAADLFEGFNPLETFLFSAKSQYMAEKIAAVSDVHGSYYHFRELLYSNGIIDSLWNWSWGSGHLVIVGDVFDKGPYVTECLWLIKKLETQAVHQGGKVHLLLGNHERLVLNGITEHIGTKYTAICKELVIDYDQIYGPETYLGRWLRTKNVTVKINNSLFTHGGISQSLVDSKLSATEINQHFNSWINREHLMEYQTDTRNNIRLIKGGIGPMEYRGYFNRNIFNRGQSDLSVEIISSSLNHFNADHIIVGHTIVKEIKGLFDNRVIAINKKYPENDIVNEKSDCEILIIEGAAYYSAKLNGEKSLLFSD